MTQAQADRAEIAEYLQQIARFRFYRLLPACETCGSALMLFERESSGELVWLCPVQFVRKTRKKNTWST